MTEWFLATIVAAVGVCAVRAIPAICRWQALRYEAAARAEQEGK